MRNTSVVLGTLSPTPTDVEHSLNTLQHLTMMKPRRAIEVFGSGDGTSDATVNNAVSHSSSENHNSAQPQQLAPIAENEASSGSAADGGAQHNTAAEQYCAATVGNPFQARHSRKHCATKHAAVGNPFQTATELLEGKESKAIRERQKQLINSQMKPIDEELCGFSKFEGRGSALHSKLQDWDQKNTRMFSQVVAVGGSLMKKYDAENVKYERFIDLNYHKELLTKVEEDLWVLQEADVEVLHPLTMWQSEQFYEKEKFNVARWTPGEVRRFCLEALSNEEERLRAIPPTATPDVPSDFWYVPADVEVGAGDERDRDEGADGGDNVADGERDVVNNNDEPFVAEEVARLIPRQMNGLQLKCLGRDKLKSLLGHAAGDEVEPYRVSARF
jgi:hypothetical protein